MVKFSEWTEVGRLSIGVSAPGQRPDNMHLKVNVDRLTPGALQTDKANSTGHAEGTLQPAICTCLPQMCLEK